jgi:hypothetical protein
VRNRVAHFALVLAVAVVPAAAWADELYHINLSPPDHVGQRFHYAASETEASQTRLEAGKNVRITSDHYSSLNFHTRVDVEACDSRGMPTQLKLKVQMLRPATADTSVQPIIEPGTDISSHSIQVENNPPKYHDVFDDKDGPCHPFQEIALRRVITIGGPTESSEQQAFGTDKPLPVGGSWSLDGEPGAQLMAKLQIDAEPAHVKGNAHFLRIVKRDEIECFEIHMTVNCDKYPVHVAKDRTVLSTTAKCELTYFIARDTGRVVEATYHSRADLMVRAGPAIERSAAEIARHIKISDEPPEPKSPR